MALSICCCIDRYQDRVPDFEPVDLIPSFCAAYYPYFDRFEAISGIRIDPYNIVSIEGPNLLKFASEMKLAKATFEQGPNRIEVVLGIETLRDGTERPMVARVDRS